MSQGGILKYLDKCKKPKTSVQICKALKLSSVGMSLKTLREHGGVLFKLVRMNPNHLTYVYWSKDNGEIQDLKVQEILK